MPVTKSAKKALRQSKRKILENSKMRKLVRETIRKFQIQPTLENLSKAYSSLDTVAKKHVIHKNKAARLKSNLAKFLPKTSSKVSSKKRSTSIV